MLMELGPLFLEYLLNYGIFLVVPITWYFIIFHVILSNR